MERPVVVTGASRGIGRALALRFAARKRDLVLCARSRAELEAVTAEARSRGVEARAVACDLATLEGREELLRACRGPLGGLVNNAGFGTAGEFAQQDRAREREMVRLNVATADEVAAFALRALDSGKRVAIHGLRNALMIHSQRLAPRSAVVKIARRVMEPWLRKRSA